MTRYCLTMTLGLLFSAPAAAGPPLFDSGADGSDGALDLSGKSGSVIFDPVAIGLDLDRDNVFHFTTITIPAGVTLRLRGLELQFAPVYWLAASRARQSKKDLRTVRGRGSGPLDPRVKFHEAVDGTVDVASGATRFVTVFCVNHGQFTGGCTLADNPYRRRSDSAH